MNGAKPGASACFWVKGGAGVLVGRSVNQSIGRWAIGGGGRKVESGLVLLLPFNFDLKQREMIWPVGSPKRRAVTSQREGGRVSWGLFKMVKRCTRCTSVWRTICWHHMWLVIFRWAVLLRTSLNLKTKTSEASILVSLDSHLSQILDASKCPAGLIHCFTVANSLQR